jgi:hypothetical protein
MPKEPLLTMVIPVPARVLNAVVEKLTEIYGPDLEIEQVGNAIMIFSKHQTKGKT